MMAHLVKRFKSSLIKLSLILSFAFSILLPLIEGKF